MEIKVVRVLPESALWRQLTEYADSCSWVAGPHLAQMLREGRFRDWEAPFAALCGGAVVGFCTLLETDYYPENRYWPWISTIFVDEAFRGRGICGGLIRAAEQHALAAGFRAVYIPSDMTGFYERYGYVKIDSLVNYGGDTDSVFLKQIG